MDPEQHKVYENIVLAEEIEVWMKTPVGRHVLEQKDAAERKVLEAFRTVDPEDTKAIRLLQRALDKAQAGVDWLKDAVHTGMQLDKILRAENEVGDA